MFIILFVIQSNCITSHKTSYSSDSYASRETSCVQHYNMSYYAEFEQELIFIPTPIIAVAAIVAPIVIPSSITIPQIPAISLTTPPPHIPTITVPSISTENIIASPPSVIPLVVPPQILEASIIGSTPPIPLIIKPKISTTLIMAPPPVPPVINQVQSAININLITPPPQIPVLEIKTSIIPATIVSLPPIIPIINLPKISVSSIISSPPNIPLIAQEEELNFRKIEFCYEEEYIPVPPKYPPKKYVPPKMIIPPVGYYSEGLIPEYINQESPAKKGKYNKINPEKDRKYKKNYLSSNGADKIKYFKQKNNKDDLSIHSKRITKNHKLNYEEEKNSKKDDNKYEDHNLYDICPGWWEKWKINLDDIICENTLFYIKNCFLRDPISEKKIHASEVNFKTLRGKTLAYSDWFCKRDKEEWKFDFDSCKWINAENGREAESIH